MLRFLQSGALFVWHTGIYVWAAASLVLMDAADVYGRFVRPRLSEQWTNRIKYLPKKLTWVIAGAIVFYGAVHAYHDLRMQSIDAQAIRAYKEDVPAIGTAKHGIKFVFFPDKTTQPTRITVMADQPLIDCDVDSTGGEGGMLVENYHQVLESDRKTCSITIESPTIRPTRRVFVWLYSDEPIDRIWVDTQEN